MPVTVADNLTAAGVGLYVAIERGYFADEGLDVALERMANPTDIFTQLAAGRFDAAGSPPARSCSTPSSAASG